MASLFTDNEFSAEPESVQEVYVNPFTVIRDSREQAPYSFTGFHTDASDRGGRRPLVIPVATAGLPTGDYSIQGYEDRIAIERKSLEDLYGTLGGGRARFINELERLQAIAESRSRTGLAAVVIEASWPQILGCPPPNSRLNPKTVFRSINAWEMPGRFPGVRWEMMGTRVLAEHKVFRMLQRWWETEIANA